MDRQCKKTTDNLHMDRQCKKATAIYIWTVHIYRLYRRQCAKYTYIYSVHIVYYNCLKSSVKCPQSVMIWAAMSSAGFGPLCFLKSTVNAGIYQDILERFMLPSADKLYGDADFIFQQDLAPAHTAKGTKSWFNNHGVIVLDWPANSPDLNPIENIWGIVKRKMRDTRPNNADDLTAAIKATWASITPEQCHKLINSMPCRSDSVIHAEGGPTKYQVHRN